MSSKYHFFGYDFPAVTRQMTYGKLEQTAKQFDPDCEIRYWWSTRDCVTLDCLVTAFPVLCPYPPRIKISRPSLSTAGRKDSFGFLLQRV